MIYSPNSAIIFHITKSINIRNITVDLNLPFLRDLFLDGIENSLKEKINEAIDRKDSQTLKKLKLNNLDIILKFMECTGNYENGIKKLSELKLSLFGVISF